MRKILYIMIAFFLVFGLTACKKKGDSKENNVTGVMFVDDEIEIDVGDNHHLAWIVNPDLVSHESVSFTSSDETVATVNEKGKVTALKKGTAIILITTDVGYKTDTVLITVVEKSCIEDPSQNKCLTVVPKTSLEVIDLSDEFIIDSENLNTYKVNNDVVSYVNIEEFIAFFQGAIQELTIENNNTSLSVLFTTTYIGDFGEEQEFQLEAIFDSFNDTIYFSDFNYSEYLNVETISDFDDGLVIVDNVVEDKNTEMTMNLGKYDINIVYKDGEYYIPLYMANLLLTGDYAHVYEVNNTIYVFDNFSEAMFDEDLTQYHKLDFSNDLINHTENFLSLLFDYYYGLKDYKNVSTYIDVFNSYGFEYLKSYKSFYHELFLFMIDNDDLHTSLITTGYNLDIDSFEPDYSTLNEEHRLYKNVYNYLQVHQCDLVTEEISHEIIDDVMYIRVNAFSENTQELLEPIMIRANDYDDIVIDVKCNRGGMLAGTINLLSYMTDEPIQMNYKDEVLDVKGAMWYASRDDRYMDKNYYVVTSPSTFSAANLFASIVKENELGIIIGENSLGGACIVKYVVLPDGSMIQMSGNIGLTDNDYETIEKGVEVDHELVAIMEESVYEQKVVHEIKYALGDSSFGEDIVNFNFEVDDSVIHPIEPIIYLTSKSKKKLYAINYETGQTKYLSFDLEPERLTYYDNELYVTLLKGEHSYYWQEEDQEGGIAIVNAISLDIVKQFDINIDPYDIAVARDGFIYISSGSNQWTIITSYNREGETIHYSGIQSMSYIEMHPILDKLYTIDTASINRKIETYSISNGLFKGQYGMQNFGNLKLNGDFIEISPDGKYIFNGSGNVFIAAEDRGLDMTFYKTLNNEYRSYTFNRIEDKFYATIDNKIDIYSYNTFDSIGSIMLEDNIKKLFYNRGNLIALTTSISDGSAITVIPVHNNNEIIDDNNATYLEIDKTLDDSFDMHSTHNLYSFIIESEGKYSFNVSTDSIYDAIIYDEYGHVIDVSVINGYTFDLKPGNYYFEVLSPFRDSFNYSLEISNVKTDDYSDHFYDEKSHSVGILEGQNLD